MTITIGTKFIINLDGRKKTLQVVGSADVDPRQGKISYLSPIGEAVLGRQVGESFEVELSNGRKIQGKVIEIF